MISARIEKKHFILVLNTPYVWLLQRKVCARFYFFCAPLKRHDCLLGGRVRVQQYCCLTTVPQYLLYRCIDNTYRYSITPIVKPLHQLTLRTCAHMFRWGCWIARCSRPVIADTKYAMCMKCCRVHRQHVQQYYEYCTTVQMYVSYVRTTTYQVCTRYNVRRTCTVVQQQYLVQLKIQSTGR